MCDEIRTCEGVGDPKQIERNDMAKEIAAILAKHKVKIEEVRWIFSLATEHLVVALEEE